MSPNLAQPPLTVRLRRWALPVPLGQGHLLPRFERETLAELQRLLATFFFALICFFGFFLITDWTLYSYAAWQLLPLRALLVGAYALGWLRMRHMHSPLQAPATATAVFGVANLAIGAMLMVTGEPWGLYATPFVVAPAVLALLPMPLIWFAVNAAIVVGTYALAAALIGQLTQPEVAQILVSILGSTILFGFVHSYIARQRWEAFANKVRAEELAAQLAGELALARRIQQSLLPLAAPGWAAPDLVCWSAPAREVGGDFYAYAALPDGRVGVGVGDVSGKGLPAALLVSTCLALLQAATASAASPSALLSSLDQALRASTRATRQNCALCCVELDGPVLRVANAGGVPPLVRRAAGGVVWVDAGGFPLGSGFGHLGYREVCAELAPGDLLLLVSDGVVEAMDEAGELFGFERLERAVAALDAPSAFVAVAELREAVAAFAGPADAHDDMTIVALRVP